MNAPANIQRDHVLHSRNGHLTKDGIPGPSAPDRILDAIVSRAPPAGPVLHFHDAYINQAHGRALAERLAPHYLEAGAYPLFYVWESGPLETIANNLGEIPEDKLLQALVRKCAEWVIKKLGRTDTSGSRGYAMAPTRPIDESRLNQAFLNWFSGNGSRPPELDDWQPTAVSPTSVRESPSPEALAREITHGLDDDQTLREAVIGLHAGETRSGELLMDPAARARILTPPKPGYRTGIEWYHVALVIADVVLNALARFTNGRDHGLYCTVVEELLRVAYLDRVGAAHWALMKQDTRDSFGEHPDACGRALVQGLARLRAQGQLFPRLTLVGQGTGVLLICELLDALASAMPDLLRDELALDIIFLAPAVTHRRFAMIIDAHYRRIAHFRMFALHDPLECRDALVPILYPRSLLYFISGVLEGEATDSGWKADVDAPLLGMERYLTDIGTYPAASFPDLDKARRFLAAFPAGTAFSEVDGGPGRRSRARAHADFDREDASVESLKWLLANGF